LTESAAAKGGVQAQAMKAARVQHFGGIEAMVNEEVPRPKPGAGQMIASTRGKIALTLQA